MCIMGAKLANDSGLAGLNLPEGPKAIFEAVEPVLSGHFGPDSFRLGGGTALATLWQHRHSTDIDLFMDQGQYHEMTKTDAQRAKLAENLAKAMKAPEAVPLGKSQFTIKTAVGEVSMMTSLPPLDEGVRFTGRIANTDVALESPRLILARKLTSRIMGNGVFYARDLFDVCAASQLAPDELVAALNTLSSSDRMSIAEEISTFRYGWMESKEAGRPIIHPMRPQILVDNLDLCPGMAAEIISGDVAPEDWPNYQSNDGPAP